MIKLILLLSWLAVGVVMLLANAMFMLSRIFKRKQKILPPKPIVIPDFPISEIDAVIQNRNSTVDQLAAVAKAIAVHHPIEPRTNGKTSKSAKHLLDIIFTMSGHKNMTDELRNSMYDELSQNNPSYGREFARARKT
ncbi:MAG: hypothetical protein LBN32_01100 [Helicobacteraceae bacterium]|jgi:hypothetical protein|nr:hypothetical protein [Helicobacteraceae bacterium]